MLSAEADGSICVWHLPSLLHQVDEVAADIANGGYAANGQASLDAFFDETGAPGRQHGAPPLAYSPPLSPRLGPAHSALGQGGHPATDARLARANRFASTAPARAGSSAAAQAGGGVGRPGDGLGSRPESRAEAGG